MNGSWLGTNLRIVVTGTDTEIGKTVFAAGLTHFLKGVYWKPIQAGLDSETDSQIVRRLAELPDDRVVTEAWRLTTPASPHLAAELEGVKIDVAALRLPATPRPLVIEGAGGLMVPLTRDELLIDLFAQWRAPVVLCARTSLGTLNHTLLSLEALNQRGIPILGVALIGDPHEDNSRALAALGGAPILGRLPRLVPLTPQTLHPAFCHSFEAGLGKALSAVGR